MSSLADRIEERLTPLLGPNGFVMAGKGLFCDGVRTVVTYRAPTLEVRFICSDEATQIQVRSQISENPGAKKWQCRIPNCYPPRPLIDTLANWAEEHVRLMHYPVVVVEDRYGGTYSRGTWLAIAEADQLKSGKTRATFVLEDEKGPSGGDVEAMWFWHAPPGWIAVGNSPDDAVSNLRRGVRPTW